MREFIATVALVAVIGSPMAIARSRVLPSPSVPSSMNLERRSIPEAPVGHRQPRADQVPSEKNLMDPNDLVNQENAALDRMINGICRGC